MKTKILFIVLLSSIISILSCTDEPVLPSKEPITDPISHKPIRIYSDTAQLPDKTDVIIHD